MSKVKSRKNQRQGVVKDREREMGSILDYYPARSSNINPFMKGQGGQSFSFVIHTFDEPNKPLGSSALLPLFIPKLFQ
jgi:hypothetical protein